MGCCGQNTTGAGAAAVDTGKRVNYTKGMLLGVDDFVQDQAWHIARRHELAREVLGYGTVRGLQVAIDPGVPRVRVTPGVALMPSGTPVCVPAEQCCDINAWLAKQWDKGEWGEGVAARLGNLPFPAPLTVHVVLAYDTCLTDLVPVPGEPCRSEEDLTAASRIADCFRLELWLDAPEQIEENAVRDFADWLARVPVDTTSPPLTDEAFQQQLRDAAQAWLQPSSPQPGDFMFGSPPAGLGSTDDLMRAALRLWTTELRPLWRVRFGCGPNPVAPGGRSDTLLLAALQLSVHDDKRADTAIAIDETRRPALLSLRMVQELITQNAAPEPASSVETALAFGLAPEVGVDPAYARADHQHGTPTLPLLAGDATGPIESNEVVALRGDPIANLAPNDDDVLVFNGGQWSPRPWPLPGAQVATEQRFGQAPSAGAAATATFAKSDHSHGTPALVGDAEAVDVGSAAPQEVRVRGLRGVPVAATLPLTAGHVLTVQVQGSGVVWGAAPLPAPPVLPQPGAVVAQLQFDLPKSDGSLNTSFARADHTHGTPALVGDVVPLVAGGVQEARVVRLQGRPVANTAPQAQQVLAFNGSAWAPANPGGGSSVPPLGGDLSGAVGDAFVERLQKVPLKAATPAAGDLLTFDGGAWVPGAGGGTGGDFVEREAGPFRLVAAGHARVSLTTPTAGQVLMLSRYSALDGTMLPSRSRLELRLAFKAVVRNVDTAKHGFIVKLTPVWTEANDANGIEFSPYLVDAVKPSAGSIEFGVRLRLSSEADKGQRYELQIEVSRFEM